MSATQQTTPTPTKHDFKVGDSIFGRDDNNGIIAGTVYHINGDGSLAVHGQIGRLQKENCVLANSVIKPVEQKESATKPQFKGIKQ